MKNRMLLCIIITLFCPLSGWAQKELDSIISASTSLLFDQPDQAVKIAEEVLQKSKTSETKVRALSFMSSAYLSKRENSKSLTIALQALDLVRKTDDIRAQIEVLSSLGMQYQQLRMYDKAKDYLDEALIITNTTNSTTNLSYLLAYNATIRGFIYREQMNCEIAQNYFNRAISHFKKADKSLGITANISTLYYNKGNCFLQTTQIDSAQTSFQKSISYAEKAQASSLLSFAKKGLSEVYTADGKYQLAVQELIEADTLAANVGDMVLNRGIYQNLANNFLALGNKNQYKFYNELYENANQNLLINERELINKSLQNSLTSVKNETENQLKKLTFLFWMIVSFGVILLLFLIIITLKSKKRFLNTKAEINSHSNK